MDLTDDPVLLSASTCSVSGRGHHGTHLPTDAMPGSIPYVRRAPAPRPSDAPRGSPAAFGPRHRSGHTGRGAGAALLYQRGNNRTERRGSRDTGTSRGPGHTGLLLRPAGRWAAQPTRRGPAPPAPGRLPARPCPRRRRPRGSPHRLAAAGCRPSGCTRAPAPRSAGCSGPWLGTAPCWRAGSRRRRGTEGGTGGRGAPAAAAARGPGAEGGMAGAGARAPEQPRARGRCPGAGARAGGAGASSGSAPAAARDSARPRPARA